MRGSRKITSLARALAPFANRTAGSVVDRIISAAAGAGIFVEANTIHLSGSTILLRHPGAARLAEYPATTEGLQAAGAAAVAGDTVLLPGGEITRAAGTLTVSASRATVKALVYPGSAPAGWNEAGFDDSAWSAPGLGTGVSGVGAAEVVWFGGRGDRVLLRQSFTLSSPVASAVLTWDGDDTTNGVYVNGVLVDRWAGWISGDDHPPRTVDVAAHLNPSGENVIAIDQSDAASGSWRGVTWELEIEQTGISIPAGVEVIGLGKNSIIDGSIFNEGTLTNLTVTGTIRGAGALRLVYNAGGEQITDLVGFAAADHDHLLNDLTDVDTSSAVTGDILTYDRLEAPLSAAAKATIIATASHGAATLSNALDGIEDTLQYSSGTNQVVGMFVQFDFGAPVTLTEIEMVCLYGENINSDYPSAWIISASDTGSFSGEETVVYGGGATMMGRLACPLDAPHEARYWRITLTAKKSNWWRVNEFNFVEVSEMGWSSKPLPDHGHTAGDIDSTGASDGQVLTADGLGGAAWKTPAGGSVAASAVTVDASGFAGNLSAADTDVQTALETLDAMTAGGAGTLGDLTDVTISSPSAGQVLKYNGSAWVNGTDATGEGGTSSGTDVLMVQVFS